jgi:hypothetical protein
MLGGPKPSRNAAYVATGAIGLAFVLCLTGFIIFLGHHADHRLRPLIMDRGFRPIAMEYPERAAALVSRHLFCSRLRAITWR